MALAFVITFKSILSSWARKMKICIFNQKGFVDEKKWAWKCLRKKVYTGEGILTLFNRKLQMVTVSTYVCFQFHKLHESNRRRKYSKEKSRSNRWFSSLDKITWSVIKASDKIWVIALKKVKVVWKVLKYHFLKSWTWLKNIWRKVFE